MDLNIILFYSNHEHQETEVKCQTVLRNIQCVSGLAVSQSGRDPGQTQTQANQRTGWDHTGWYEFWKGRSVCPLCLLLTVNSH